MRFTSSTTSLTTMCRSRTVPPARLSARNSIVTATLRITLTGRGIPVSPSSHEGPVRHPPSLSLGSYVVEILLADHNPQAPRDSLRSITWTNQRGGRVSRSRLRVDRTGDGHLSCVPKFGSLRLAHQHISSLHLWGRDSKVRGLREASGRLKWRAGSGNPGGT